jgi:hypothetical protein
MPAEETLKMLHRWGDRCLAYYRNATWNKQPPKVDYHNRQSEGKIIKQEKK